jgi:hypothetical protein
MSPPKFDCFPLCHQIYGTKQTSTLVHPDFGHITCCNHSESIRARCMALPDKVKYDGEQEYYLAAVLA